MDSYVLILYYSRYGATRALAEHIALGVESAGCEARLRTVPSVSATTEATEPAVPEQGAPYCSQDDLAKCSAFILGSPTRFGNMAAALKYFLDSTAPAWINGQLIGKPAGVFTSTSSLHGGQESTLLSMMLPLLHHGMLISGVPYSVEDLHTTDSGGTPYGPSHLAREKNGKLSDAEKRICHSFGERIATLAITLHAVTD